MHFLQINDIKKLVEIFKVKHIKLFLVVSCVKDKIIYHWYDTYKNHK